MTAAASNAVKLELPGSVSISNVAGGGMPRFLRRRFARGILLEPADPNASIPIFSSLPHMPPPRTMIGLGNKIVGCSGKKETKCAGMVAG
ncbi:hypothetical protein [Bradyrhizobium japonicum]|uniref:hypothetical protein n=1 Tax=Bradyrhizobium japonicum TaxID=375 RepID=UPI00190F8103|nr:hypothetical protein [Bradyrhizobium japonicum]